MSLFIISIVCIFAGLKADGLWVKLVAMAAGLWGVFISLMLVSHAASHALHNITV